MDINQNASVRTERDVIIRGKLGKVWNTFTNVNEWSRAYKQISMSQLNGRFEAGNKFKCRIGRGPEQIYSVEEVVFQQKIGLVFRRGNSILIQIFEFIDRYDGTVRVVCRASVSGGCVLHYFGGLITPRFDKVIGEQLNALKTVCENSR